MVRWNTRREMDMKRTQENGKMERCRKGEKRLKTENGNDDDMWKG